MHRESRILRLTSRLPNTSRSYLGMGIGWINKRARAQHWLVSCMLDGLCVHYSC
ncbi:hypothetical protein C8R42DRAFT_681647 [Lentinula raphanica]|nr:hypothetical protein C8R42DRAFT_681647 [Lentinula raphanica]